MTRPSPADAPHDGHAGVPARGQAGRVGAAGHLAQRLVGAVVGALTTPLNPRDFLALVDPVRFGPDLAGRIVARRPQTPDAVSLVIEPGPGWLGHVPGQYVRVGVEVDGVRNWRTYSLTHACDARPDSLEITVKRVADGRVSPQLVDTLPVGAVVMLGEAAGDFVMPQVIPEKILFLTGGSGITPVMGMLRNHTTGDADVVLVHSAPTSGDVIFGAELRALGASGDIRLIERHSDVQGMLDLSTELDDLVPDWRERSTWACGPGPMLDAAHALFDSADLLERLHTERFRPAAPAVVGEGGSVTFTRSRVTVDADGTTPLLQAGESEGVDMPYGCRMGICLGCTAHLTSGSVRDLRNGEVTTADHDEAPVIQTCVCAAAGPCEIDL